MTRRRRIYAGIIITVAAALLLWGVWEWTSWWVGRGSPEWVSSMAVDPNAAERGPTNIMPDPDLDRPGQNWCPPDSRVCIRLPTPSHTGWIDAYYRPAAPRYDKTMHLDAETPHDDKWQVVVRKADGSYVRYFLDRSKRTFESLLDDGDELVNMAPPVRLMGGGAKMPPPAPE